MTAKERIPLEITEIEEILKNSIGSMVISSEIKVHAEGRSRKENKSLWMIIERAALHDAVRKIIDIDYPHLGVVSAVDAGEKIELIYHLYIFFGLPGAEISINFIIPLQKSDLTIQTISDLIPGAVYTEREKQEMIEVEVKGIPDNRRLFLPPDFPENIYPWRKDEKGIPDSMIKNLWKSERPTGRPNPPVKPKEKRDPGIESSRREGAKTAEKKSAEEKSGEKDNSPEIPEGGIK